MSTVSVREEETGVRVEAATPHLVSLGGSRLSTSVTIHRLTQGTYYRCNTVRREVSIFSKSYAAH